MIYNIRPMSESDIDQVYAIETEVHIAPWTKNILRDCVRVGYRCLVLEVQIDAHWIFAGYIISRYTTTYCHILNFCITKSLQHQGYGRHFFQYLLNSLIESSTLEHVVLEVRPSNQTALHLYESMGFQRMEIKSDYYKDKDGTEDAILLKKMLH